MHMNNLNGLTHTQWCFIAINYHECHYMTLDHQAEQPWIITFVKETVSSNAINIFDSLSYPKLAKSGPYRTAVIMSMTNCGTKILTRPERTNGRHS